MSTLSGQTILIVGGSSGIGFGVAVAALQSDASTIIIASSSSSKVEGAVERLRAIIPPSSHQTVKGVVIDGRDLKSVEKVVQSIGTINHLVSTSGDVIEEMMGTPISNMDVPAIKDAGIFDVRLFAPIQAAKSATFAPGGSIILTSGSTSIKGLQGWSFASAVTSGINGITLGLAVEFAPNIRVNTVAPGIIDTELFDNMPAEGKRVMFDQLGTKTTLVRRVGTPAEVAEAYIFLMKCSFITGQTIHVNGGLP